MTVQQPTRTDTDVRRFKNAQRLGALMGKQAVIRIPATSKRTPEENQKLIEEIKAELVTRFSATILATRISTTEATKEALKASR
jgi:hypothetical protein